MNPYQSDPNVPGFLLPTVIDPPDSLCFTVKVPNDQGHIAAFLGAMFELTQWLSWQRDPLKRGKDAAAIWREIWVNLVAQSCNPPIPPSLIGIEQEDLMPLRVDCDCNVFVTCCDGTEKQILTSDQVKALIQQQPGSGAPQPPAGGCQTYHSDLPANQIFLVPFPVNTGDTITIQNANGAVHDNQVIDWSCPDGDAYFAGGCTTIVEPAQPGDPLSTANHGQLIIEIAGTFYALTVGTAFTVPSGVVNQQPTIQANLQLSTASGSFQFDVEVCNNQAGTWTHTFDFTLSPSGFSIQAPFGTPLGSWSAGIGFVSGDDLDPGGAWFRRCEIAIGSVSPNFAIDTWDILYNYVYGVDASGTETGLELRSNLGGTYTTIISELMAAVPTGTGVHATSSTPVTGQNGINLYMACSEQLTQPALGGSLVIRALTVTGHGPNPF